MGNPHGEIFRLRMLRGAASIGHRQNYRFGGRGPLDRRLAALRARRDPE